MLSIVKSFTLEGLNGFPIDVEVDIQRGIPSFDIVGLPSSTVRESRNRVRSAIINSCFEFFANKVTVNLAPADRKKEGSLFDLPIAIGFLASTEQIVDKHIGQYVIVGELSLDGSVRRVNGIMPILISGLQMGYKKYIIPAGNEEEASYLKGVDVYAVKTLSDVTSFLSGILAIEPIKKRDYIPESAANKYGVDMADVKGQLVAKRALEVAVAGGHNMLMCGSPGAGKSLLAKCIVTIMPDMSFDEAIETTKIHSVAGLITKDAGMVLQRPFRSPHHTASLHSLTGGGTKSTPGEISMAHNGVLFLDEMPEYSQKALETLRQPLEDGVITISRVAQTVEYPARFMLMASMNPCPCGYDGSRLRQCTCTPNEKRKYKAKVSGPLLDRIDIYVEVDGIEYNELRGNEVSESSAAVKARVANARAKQAMRFSEAGIHTNAEMNNAMLKEYCKLDKASEDLLQLAYKKFKLSARGATRVIKIARTIADLAGNKDITRQDIAEAVQYRTKGLQE